MKTIALVKALQDAPLLVREGQAQSVPFKREFVPHLVEMMEICAPDDVELIHSIIGGESQKSVGRRFGVAQPSLHYRLHHIVRWLSWCPPRRIILHEQFRRKPPPAYSGRTDVDLVAAWNYIIWQHWPLTRVAPMCGAGTQGKMRHVWFNWLEELSGRAYPDEVLGVLADLQSHPCYWRKPRSHQLTI